MNIHDNLENVKSKIPEEVTLIAVTKTRNIDEMKVVYESGLRDFGENKVQELVEKYDAFPKDLRWHLIGKLQRNKVKYIAGKVYLIHSLDNVKLLQEIEKQFSKINKVAQVLIEINIGREDTKSGILLEELDELLNMIEECNNVRVRGLMAIIPKGDEESCRKYFREMKSIWDELKNNKYKNISMDYLSMGMTNDFVFAIQEGSNMVRVGEGIFGKRNYNKDVKEDL
jgi:pyridoxal phosphate enzyme (YggS family)